MNQRIEAAVLITLGMVTGWAWHQLYVVPHDEARHQIIECMGSDNSQEAYTACVKELRPND